MHPENGDVSCFQDSSRGFSLCTSEGVVLANMLKTFTQCSNAVFYIYIYIYMYVCICFF